MPWSFHVYFIFICINLYMIDVNMNDNWLYWHSIGIYLFAYCTLIIDTTHEFHIENPESWMKLPINMWQNLKQETASLMKKIELLEASKRFNILNFYSSSQIVYIFNIMNFTHNKRIHYMSPSGNSWEKVWGHAP